MIWENDNYYDFSCNSRLVVNAWSPLFHFCRTIGMGCVSTRYYHVFPNYAFLTFCYQILPIVSMFSAPFKSNEGTFSILLFLSPIANYCTIPSTYRLPCSCVWVCPYPESIGVSYIKNLKVSYYLLPLITSTLTLPRHLHHANMLQGYIDTTQNIKWK